jgi:SAM-dependent methyltransferase
VSASWAMPAGTGDAWAQLYERGRPGWPTAALEAAGVPPDARVLDLGAGTGKLTALLCDRFADVVAVEPAHAMREVLGRRVPRAHVLAGTAHEVPLAEASLDAVFAAQAFHWFDDERGLAEISRVLRPEGALVLLWNLPAGPWSPSAEAAEALLLARQPSDVDHVPLDLGGPRAGGGWRPEGAEAFGLFDSAVVANPQTLDRDGLVAFYATMGWLADLPDAERLPLLAAVRGRLEAERYERLWETHVHWARRCAA